MLTKGRKKGFEVEHTTKKGSEPAKAECWLECEDEEIFSIHVRNTRKCPTALAKSGWECKVIIDGRELVGDSVFLPECRKWACYSADMKTAEGQATCDMQFIPRRLTDDPNQVAVEVAALTDFGTIEVRMRRGWFEEAEPGSDRGWETADLGLAAEGMLKSNAVNPVLDAERFWWEFMPHDDDVVWHHFIFKYRTRAVLQLMNIIAPDGRDAAQTVEEGQAVPAKAKRKADVVSPIDLTSDDIVIGSSEDAHGKPLEREELKDKRIKFLEEQLRRQAKRMKAAEPSADQLVDLTQDNE